MTNTKRDLLRQQAIDNANQAIEHQPEDSITDDTNQVIETETQDVIVVLEKATERDIIVVKMYDA